MLGTNFRDYAIVFTQLEAQEEAFSTVEVYSECAGLRPSHQPHPGQKPPTGPANKGWTLRKISKNLEDILIKLGLLDIQKAPKKRRGRPKKNNVEWLDV